ncbi:GMC oxidoreductase [Variovorax ginsengisoli]|uniref:GMC oxidoreductase n=1 Tax=Variovorax ginsengisoli TaxID=363844 RepID=A0ABT8S498_9BURK|nr:GMC oxidoreductase [Variovorax ginsengisoli]MDN8614570.1 GMC oxidoreductase [Variovorax ginsengisoli]MDO1533740.1 GMC oxidoreductase [Variovorax ginsengisoli]
MIADLVGSGTVARKADIVVVGGGTAGLVASVLLARSGKFSVICLESGGMHQDAEEHPLNEVVHTRSHYAGAAHGRFRCIGGTSTRWGGALIPFLGADLVDGDWPMTWEDLAPFVEKVEALFGLEAGPYVPSDFPVEIGASHVPRLAKWPAFKRRNVFNLLAPECESDRGPQIWLHATVTEMSVAQGRLHSIRARAEDGSAITVEAGSFIIAAGAIETTRLALLLDQQNGQIISKASPALGRYFSDHLSVEIAELRPIARRTLNRIVGFRFEKNGTMRNLRFELAEQSPARAELPPCFAHIAFRDDQSGGFFALREFFRHVQRLRLPPASVFARLALAMPWLSRAVWWRIVEKRLLFPSAASLVAHMVIAQESDFENRISLSGAQRDAFGVPRAQVEWSVTEKDVANLTKAVDAFETMWRDSGLAQLAQWVRRPSGEAELELAKGGGIYHPTGSTRMGATAREGVVDRDLRVHAVPNVQLLSTSVLPTGGGANPTMTLMLLALRCVEGFEKAAC